MCECVCVSAAIIVNHLVIHFKQWLLIESRLQYTYTHVDKLYKNAGKMQVNMVTQNIVCVSV